MTKDSGSLTIRTEINEVFLDEFHYITLVRRIKKFSLPKNSYRQRKGGPSTLARTKVVRLEWRELSRWDVTSRLVLTLETRRFYGLCVFHESSITYNE